MTEQQLNDNFELEGEYSPSGVKVVGNLNEVFIDCTKVVPIGIPEKVLTVEELFSKFYGLFKQATCGDV